MAYQYKLQPLSSEDIDRLVNSAQTFRERLVIYCLLDTGLRVAELAGLMKSHVQWHERRLVVYHGDGRTKQRVIPMTERVRMVLTHHFALENTMNFSVRTVQHTVRRVAKRAGLTSPVSPHVLRHTFGVTCLRKGMSLATVSRILGHSSLSTTVSYLDLLPGDIQRDFEDRW